MQNVEIQKFWDGTAWLVRPANIPSDWWMPREAWRCLRQGRGKQACAGALPRRRFLQEGVSFVEHSCSVRRDKRKRKTQNTYRVATILSPHLKDVSVCLEDSIQRHPGHTETQKSEAWRTTCLYDSAVFFALAAGVGFLISGGCSKALIIRFPRWQCVCKFSLRRLGHDWEEIPTVLCQQMMAKVAAARQE